MQTAALIRGRPRSEKTPIIFITSYAQTEIDALSGYSLGAVDYIFAPVIPQVLKAKVQVFVDLFRLARQLKSQAEQLAAANRELEAFPYSVSHDLHAPLRFMDGFSRILLEKHQAGLDAQGQNLLHRIRAACQHMGRLIDDLLMLSRLTRSELRREPLDLGALAREILTDLQTAQPDRSVEVIIADGLAATGDPGLLRQAMENLLSNAWKFTGREPQARIEFGVASLEGEPAFFVRDNGAGFDPAVAQKLFAPFQRLHTAEGFPGSGIGLSIVQRIIHRHGGRIWAQAAPGQGATFFFTLP